MSGKKKNKSFFWASYSDLMTSLFFIMLTLFVITIVQLNNKTRDLENKTDEIDSLYKATKAQLETITNIEEATKDLDSTYFEYKDQYKKHRLKISVFFPELQSSIEKVPEDTREQLYLAGLSVKQHIDSTTHNNPGIQYLLIIEGQASNTGQTYDNYVLSYKRAYELKKYWELRGIRFNQTNCEVLICGSGDGVQSGTGLMREQNEILNQRFLIHLLPKPGQIATSQ